MLVRPVRPEEWHALRELRLRALATDPTAFGATLEEARKEGDEAWRARAAAAPGRVVLVADAGGALVGMLCGERRDGDEAELLALWTAPEARRAGVGRALMEAGLAWARGERARRVTLWVNAANAEALRLYERCGFAALGAPRQGSRDPTRWFVQMARPA